MKVRYHSAEGITVESEVPPTTSVTQAQRILGRLCRRGERAELLDGNRVIFTVETQEPEIQTLLRRLKS